MTSVVAYDTATDPSAGGTVAATGALTPGRYTVTVVTKPSGTLASGDADNVQLQAGSTVIGQLMQSGTAGTPTTNPAIEVEFTTAEAIKVTAVADASGSSAVYGALIVATAQALFPSP